MRDALTRKRGPLPAWGWAVVIVGAVLAYRYWRSRQSSTDAGGGAVGPSSGLQPIGAGLGPMASAFGSPIGSASVVSPPTANGVGSSTVGTTALHANKITGGSSTGGGASSGFESQSDFERGNVPQGYSGESILAAARKYAAGRSYGGYAYDPHSIQQEGTITYHDGKPGVMIKYGTGNLGSSTEWTPI